MWYHINISFQCGCSNCLPWQCQVWQCSIVANHLGRDESWRVLVFKIGCCLHCEVEAGGGYSVTLIVIYSCSAQRDSEVGEVPGGGGGEKGWGDRERGWIEGGGGWRGRHEGGGRKDRGEKKEAGGGREEEGKGRMKDEGGGGGARSEKEEGGRREERRGRGRKGRREETKLWYHMTSWWEDPPVTLSRIESEVTQASREWFCHSLCPARGQGLMMIPDDSLQWHAPGQLPGRTVWALPESYFKSYAGHWVARPAS